MSHDRNPAATHASYPPAVVAPYAAFVTDGAVPDRSRRIVEVHQLPDIFRFLDGGRLVATHPVLEGRRQYRVDPAHRQGGAARALRHGDVGSVIIGRRGDHVAQRSLAFYQALGERLATGETLNGGGRP